MTAPEASRFARHCAVLYLLLIVVASLHPFSGWRDPGAPPFIFLSAAFPYYWTVFDLAVNVLVYLPAGFFLFLFLRRRLPRSAAVLLAVLGAAALSLLMEILQNWLPARVPSNVDLICNAFGALLGALLGVAQRERWDSLLRAQASHLSAAPDAEFGLLLLALWLILQLTPGQLLFGVGDLRLWGPEAGFVSYSADSLRALEAAAVACQMLAVGLLIRHVLAAQAWSTLPILLLFFLVAIVFKAVSLSVILHPGVAFDWLTSGARQGLLVGASALVVAVFLPPRTRLIVIGLAILGGMLAVNLIPETPYAPDAALKESTGPFFNFVGLTRWLGLAWPFLFLAWWGLLLSRSRKPRQ